MVEATWLRAYARACLLFMLSSPLGATAADGVTQADYFDVFGDGSEFEASPELLDSLDTDMSVVATSVVARACAEVQMRRVKTVVVTNAKEHDPSFDQPNPLEGSLRGP